MYGVKIEDISRNEETFYFTNDTSVDLNVDISSGVKKYKSEHEELSINLTLPEKPLYQITSAVTTKTLTVEGHNLNTEGCGANAGGMIVNYWDQNGYAYLILSDATEDTYESELKTRMGTFNVGAGQATLIDGYINGLQSYFSSRSTSFWSLTMTKNYVNLKSQINANNPGTILYWGNGGYYGYHYVVFNGYAENLDTDEYFYIIKDGWSGNENTYRNWDTDSPSIGSIIKTYKH
jgi:hypothetical protein